ncbi:MAG: PAS domain S-box protein [Bdellovibrionales bacterium]|nr:PAS domain S-box protein [Bdellovibrionales bacterium]
MARKLAPTFSTYRDPYVVVLSRTIAYLLIISILSLFAGHIFFEGSGYEASDIFLLVAIVAVGQALVVFGRDLHSPLYALFLADSAVAMALVRASGSSSSPFLVLFPIISLGGSILFNAPFALVLAALNVVFMSLAVGFGVAILGNGAAIVATTCLGLYLMRALRRSDIALNVSEDARRRLENLQKAILANIPSGLMSVDSQGRIIQINRVGVRILNVAESDVLNRSLRDVLPGVHEQIHRLNTLVPLLEFQESSPDRPTVRYRRKDSGEELQLGYSVARLTDPDDKEVLGSLVVFQDLTAIIKLEESLRLSEKLAAVGKLAAGIAHEIRNPLAGISGSAQLLGSLSDLGEDDRKLLTIIQRESARLDSLITEFLEYVRPPTPKLEAVELNDVVSRLIESLKVNSKWQQLSCEITLKNLGSESTLARGDVNKITQVLMNLALNSGQAGAHRAEITVGPGPVVELRDDGSGIPLELQARIFEPFFTTKEKGTGLGLAVSYRVLESMEAKVQVVSPLPDFAAKGGTMIRIEFKGAS